MDESGRYRRPIVTEIVPAARFWDAEDYHQKYFSRRGIAATCNIPARSEVADPTS
jgi:peptide-methionine (S)-S-oxide reductase